MIEFLKNNISWLKDFFTLILTATGTIIAILTYRRAKATILQPIRSEVFKKQTELLSDLLELLFENDRHFDTGLEYKEMSDANALILMNDYGFDSKFDAEELTKAKATLQGGVFTKNKLENWHRIKPFGETLILVAGQEITKKRLENGEVKVGLIQTTKNHKELVSKLDYYINHPLMPTMIQTTLKELKTDISYNLSTALTTVLDKFINELPKQIKTNPSIKVNLSGISNDFITERRSHKQLIDQLTSDIRNHLRVDEQWIS